MCPEELVAEQRVTATTAETTSVPAAAAARYHCLIPADRAHPGAGAVYSDGGYPAGFLTRLDDLYAQLPAPASPPLCPTSAAATPAAAAAATVSASASSSSSPASSVIVGPTRRWFCDTLGWIAQTLAPVAAAALGVSSIYYITLPSQRSLVSCPALAR